MRETNSTSKASSVSQHNLSTADSTVAQASLSPYKSPTRQPSGSPSILSSHSSKKRKLTPARDGDAITVLDDTEQTENAESGTKDQLNTSQVRIDTSIYSLLT